MGNAMKLFLDSGAFSADSKGAPIDIYEYIEFIKKNKKHLEVWANLDVIGDAKATWKNQEIMEKAGVGGIPVYHIEDDIKYLYRCLDYPYFALGGIAGKGSSEKRRLHFLDMCFDIICDKNGHPKNKVHGFGLASPKYVFRYPWYSFDSSSWVSYGRFGIVILPAKRGGKFVYDKAPIKIFVSSVSPRKGEDGQHFQTLSKQEQRSFLDYLESKNVKFGKSTFFTYDMKHTLTSNQRFANKSKLEIEEVNEIGVTNDNMTRDFVNYCFYVDMALEASRTEIIFKRKNQMLF